MTNPKDSKGNTNEVELAELDSKGFPLPQGALYTNTITHPCSHQWFEIKKIEKSSCLISTGSCKGEHTTLNGILLKCANCLETKELWE